MFITNKSRISKLLPYVSGHLHKALAYLQETDFSKLPVGRYEVDGDNIYFMVSEYDTKPKEEKKAETHIKYIDIQYIVKGEEKIHYTDYNSNLEITEDKRVEKDGIFYNTTADVDSLLLREDMLGVLFPWEVHRPGCNVGENSVFVKKVVFKVKKG